MEGCTVETRPFAIRFSTRVNTPLPRTGKNTLSRYTPH